MSLSLQGNAADMGSHVPTNADGFKPNVNQDLICVFLSLKYINRRVKYLFLWAKYINPWRR